MIDIHSIEGMTNDQKTSLLFECVTDELGNLESSVTTGNAEIKEKITQLELKVTKINLEIAMLKVKSGMWGALAGGVPATIGLVIMYLTGKL
jgi:hypothetical protein